MLTALYAVFGAGGLKVFIKNVVKAAFIFGNKFANNSVRALDNASNVFTSIASRNPSKGLSTKANLIQVATTSEGLSAVQSLEVHILVQKKIDYL